MTPPASPGQRNMLQAHYERIGDQPVAFLDETYELSRGRNRFYAMAAVVVLAKARNPFRDDLDELVPGGYWHTTEALRKADGLGRSLDLLDTFEEEACVIVNKISVAKHDTDGSQAREAVLETLLVQLHQASDGRHDPVGLAVAEEQHEAKKNSFDHSIHKRLVEEGKLPKDMRLLTVSPGSDHLLWLPDLVCSAYRQSIVHGNDTMLDKIADLVAVTEVP